MPIATRVHAGTGCLDGTYKYVSHSQVERYLAMGWWIVSGLGGSHGNWSVLMQAPMCLEAA